MEMIVVNNPAAKTGGALTILKEFLEKIVTLKCNRNFYIIVSLKELKKYETKKIKIEVIESQGFKERILWDNFGLKSHLKNKEIKPNLFISIQNTAVKLDKNIPQIIYYHQMLSIVDLKWNFFKKNQRIYWLYKNIYPFFIKQHLNKVKKIIVQTNWAKECFYKKLDYSRKNIIVITPSIKKIDVDKIRVIPKNKYRIFYPAAPLIYKNHKLIIDALGQLKKENIDLIKNIECIFTFNENENLEITKLIYKYNLETTIKLIGKISYSRVLEYYKSSDLLIFPSYLETYGLPLLEAQAFNLPIIALNLPYVKEVLIDYKEVHLINSIEEMKKICLKKIESWKYERE